MMIYESLAKLVLLYLYSFDFEHFSLDKVVR